MAKAYLAQAVDAGNTRMKGSRANPGFDNYSATLAEHLVKFREQQVSQATQVTAGALATANKIRLGMLLSGMTAAVLAAILDTWVVRSIMRQMGGEPSEAARVAQRVGNGDLSQNITVQSRDTSSLMSQLMFMQQSLSDVVATVRHGAEGVATASAEIAQGNNDLSARTKQQASALEETAASMEELGDAVKQNADNAHQADQLAKNASAVAAKGGGGGTRG